MRSASKLKSIADEKNISFYLLVQQLGTLSG